MEKRFKKQLDKYRFVLIYDAEKEGTISIGELVDIANELDQDNKGLEDICRKQAKVLKKHGITLKQIIEEMK